MTVEAPDFEPDRPRTERDSRQAAWDEYRNDVDGWADVAGWECSDQWP